MFPLRASACNGLNDDERLLIYDIHVSYQHIVNLIDAESRIFRNKYTSNIGHVPILLQ